MEIVSVTMVTLQMDIVFCNHGNLINGNCLCNCGNQLSGLESMTCDCA